MSQAYQDLTTDPIKRSCQYLTQDKNKNQYLGTESTELNKLTIYWNRNFKKVNQTWSNETQNIEDFFEEPILPLVGEDFKFKNFRELGVNRRFAL